MRIPPARCSSSRAAAFPSGDRLGWRARAVATRPDSGARHEGSGPPAGLPFEARSMRSRSAARATSVVQRGAAAVATATGMAASQNRSAHSTAAALGIPPGAHPARATSTSD